ncbi:MAG: PAS domain S-box protein, partial [Syntrophobacterales bacterium]
DRDTRFLFMNEGYRARHGVALEDIIGKTYGEVHSREKADSFALKVEKIFETGKPIQHESYGRDGECFLKTLSPVKDQNGRTRAVTTVSKNITSHKKVEEALRESEARHRSVFENTNTATVIIEEDMTISMMNTAFEKLSGYSKKEVEGTMRWTDFVAPQEIDRMKPYHDKRRKKKGAAPTEYEFCFIDKEGNTRDIFVTAGMIPGTNRSVCSLMDITESKRAETALRESEERYRALFDNNPIETIIVDREAKVTGYNLAKKLSGNRLPHINKGIMYKDYAAKHKNNMFEELRECIRSGISKEFLEQEYEDKFLDIKIAPFSEGAIMTSIDVTNRKRAEAQRKNLESPLQQAQKLKAIGTLAGGLAHDFNNLLMGIQGNASLILLDMDSSHPHYEKLRNIEQYVRDGAELTGQLLGFARGGKYEVKPTDLNKLGQKSSDMFGRTKKEIKIHKKYQQDIWMVEVDQGQIEQTLLNIYVNAWQAMPGGGEIYLQTENVTLDKDYLEPHNLEPGNYVRISITDTGTGMDAETAKRVFDPFFTTKEMGRGTGLGMASAYGIIKNHNGVISVYSEEGIGTTFNIYLPALGAAVSDQGSVIRKEQPMMGHETILLVDDEELIIDVGGEILKFLGYTVFLARSGKEAIEIYKEEQGSIDLVILDMIMPDIGGGEAYDILKKINP